MTQEADSNDVHFWQEKYEQGETPWDKGEPSPGLVDFLADHNLNGRILVPGCGSGHDVRAIAFHRLYALDVHDFYRHYFYWRYRRYSRRRTSLSICTICNIICSTKT